MIQCAAAELSAAYFRRNSCIVGDDVLRRHDTLQARQGDDDESDAAIALSRYFRVIAADDVAKGIAGTPNTASAGTSCLRCMI